MKRSPGRTKEIGGRPYVSFEDCCSWRGRKVKGDLRSSVSAGFTTASWNTWLGAKSGKGRLAGVPVDRLQCYLEEHDYLVCPYRAEERLKRRASLLSIMSKVGSPCRGREQAVWKDIAGLFLSKVYAFHQVALHTLEVGDLEDRVAALEELTKVKK